MIFRPLVWENQAHGPHLLYQTWLPFLNDKPLYCNLDNDRLEWRTPPRGNDASRFRATKEVMHYICRRWGCSLEQAKCVSLLLRWEFLAMCLEDASRLPALSASANHLLTIAMKQTAHAASKAARANVISISSLHELNATLEALQAKLDSFANKAKPPPPPPFTAGACAFEPFPYFELLMPSETETLAGPAKPLPIVRPVQLTLVKDHVNSLEEVCQALQHAHNLCMLIFTSPSFSI